MVLCFLRSVSQVGQKDNCNWLTIVEKAPLQIESRRFIPLLHWHIMVLMELLIFSTVTTVPNNQTLSPILARDSRSLQRGQYYLHRYCFKAQKNKYPNFQFSKSLFGISQFFTTSEYFTWNAVISAKLYFNSIAIKII